MQIGTACVTRGQDSRLALGRLGGLVEQLETLVRSGKQVILVTSGRDCCRPKLCLLGLYRCDATKQSYRFTANTSMSHYGQHAKLHAAPSSKKLPQFFIKIHM